VDFGIGYRKDDKRPDVTYTNETVGNVFSRPPETMPGSANQRSPVQDISNTCSLLLYVLTGESTGLFQNDSDQLPHQRPNAVSKLQDLDYAQRAQLNTIFDKAFQNDIKKRFQTVEELRQALYTAKSLPSPIDRKAADYFSELKSAFAAKQGYDVGGTNVLISIADLIKKVYMETQTELGTDFKVESLIENSADSRSLCILVVRMYHDSDLEREFACRYRIERIGSEIVISTDLPSWPTLKRVLVDHVEKGYTSAVSVSTKQLILPELNRRLLLPNLSTVHRTIFSLLKQQQVKSIQQEIQNISNPRDDKLRLGFEELGWLLKPHDLVLEWHLGATTVVDESGPKSVDMPSVLRLGTPDSTAVLEFWTDGSIKAIAQAIHKFPGGCETIQVINTGFPEIMLKNLIQGKNLRDLSN
jgi:serine/threonine protein kinase